MTKKNIHKHPSTSDEYRRINESSDSETDSEFVDIDKNSKKKINENTPLIKKKVRKTIKKNSGSKSSTIKHSDEKYSISSIENKNKIPRKKSIKNSNEIFKELIKKQINDIPTKWKLNINDMKRICKYIDNSIFDANKCCIWNGYITNINHSNKGTYVNFYFRNKKVALHRLLYSNFVSPLDHSEYLKFNCENKGKCCNINHYEKYKYSKNFTNKNTSTKQKENKKEVRDISIFCDDPEKLIISFD